jgi:hypothetical protein
MAGLFESLGMKMVEGPEGPIAFSLDELPTVLRALRWPQISLLSSILARQNLSNMVLCRLAHLSSYSALQKLMKFPTIRPRVLQIRYRLLFELTTLKMDHRSGHSRTRRVVLTEKMCIKKMLLKSHQSSLQELWQTGGVAYCTCVFGLIKNEVQEVDYIDL